MGRISKRTGLLKTPDPGRPEDNPVIFSVKQAGQGVFDLRIVISLTTNHTNYTNEKSLTTDDTDSSDNNGSNSRVSQCFHMHS